MNCPKCNYLVSENDLTCPNCKKILKLKCPQCSTISKKNICPECEYIMLSKCFKCGRLNPTNQLNCIKCGMSVVASIALKEAIIDQFAVLSIEIVNFEVIKTAFDSKKIVKQFKDNLYNIIKNQAIDAKVRVQDINNVLIIRFCKDEDFRTSCSSATNFALNVSQLIMEINKKLHDLKKVYLKIKMNIYREDLEENSATYESRKNIEVIYGSEKGNEIYKNIQILVETYIYKILKNKYPFESLRSVFVKGEMVTFYELILNKVLQMPEELENKGFMDISSSQDFEVEEDDDDGLPIISLTEKKCSFLKVKPGELYNHVIEILNSNVANPIINVKGSYNTGKLNNLDLSTFTSEIKNINIFTFYCTNLSKVYPFGLCRDIIKSFYNINEYDIVLNSNENQSVNKLIASAPQLYNLLYLSDSKINNLEEVRYKIFENMSTFFSSLKKKTLFIIHDFENIDRGSLDIIKYLIENDLLGNASFLISCDSEFYLHRHIYKLISQENFYELELKLCSNKEIVNSYVKKLRKIEKSFFFKKIIENMKGSRFYFTQALDYLVENEILIESHGIYDLNQNKMIVIPPSLEELVKKRLSVMAKDENTFKLYVVLILLGREIPISVIKLTNIDNLDSRLEALQKRKLIDIIDYKIIKLKNYNLYKENFLSIIEANKLTEIAKELCETVVQNFNSIHPIAAECLEYSNGKKQAFTIWNQLANISLSLGDFATYINCCTKYLNLIEEAIEKNEETPVEVAKLEIYEQISNLLYKYYPEKVFNYLDILVENAELSGDDKRVKNLSNIMVQSCLLSGDYNHALEYIGKVISRTSASSFNPVNKDFNLGYYLTNLVVIEIYFNLGKLEECIDLGDEIFKFIKTTDIKLFLPQDFSPKRFKDLLKETQILVSIARIVQLKENTVKKLEELITFYSEDKVVFEILIEIYNLLLGNFDNFNQNIQNLQNKSENLDSQTKAFCLIYKLIYFIQAQQWNEAGNTAHFAKKFAAERKLHQISLFLDLIIGFSYNKIGNIKKAKQIYYDVLKLSAEKGLMNVTILNWYLLAEMEFEQNNINVAHGILNKAMATVEKEQNISKLFTFSFKLILARIFAIQGELEKSIYCANHSFEIAVKSNLVNKSNLCAIFLLDLYQALSQSEQDASKIALYQDKVNQINSFINGAKTH